MGNNSNLKSKTNNTVKKTILYLTINLINFKIYIGVHDIDPLHPWDGYLGDGVNRFCPSSIKHPKNPFPCAVKKYGFDAFYRITLMTFDTRKEALDMEAIIVNEEFLKRSDVYNIALGGGDPPHETRHVYQYDLNGNFVAEFNSLTNASSTTGVSIGGIINAINFHIISANSFWTDNYVKSLNLDNYTDTTQAKSVYLYDCVTYEYEKTFDSINECARTLGVTPGVVQRAIKSQTKIRKYYISFEKLDKFVKEKTLKHYSDEVHQYSLSGEYIQTFSCVNDVVKQLGKTYSSISTSIRLQGTCGGFQWSWDKIKSMPNKEKNVYKAKRIGQYTLDGNLVKIYDTLRSCRKDFGNVGKVLKGQASQCKGFTFKYMD